VSSFFTRASPTLLEKPGTEALDDVKKCFVAGGGHGQTGGRLNDGANYFGDLPVAVN
jgi:hypothetical protein